MLVGVADPDPITDDNGRRVSFPALPGVAGDLDWYEHVIKSTAQGRLRDFDRRDTPDRTLKKELEDAITAMATSMAPNDLFILVFAGHGYQLPVDPKVHWGSDYEGALNDAQNGLDEILVVSGGKYIRDDFFAELWANRATWNRSMLIIIDSCCSDTVPIGLAPANLHVPGIEPLISPVEIDADFRVNAPAILVISASEAGEVAYNNVVRGRDRGVLSSMLERAWIDEGQPSSYEAWFARAATYVHQGWQQNPHVRFVGPGRLLFADARPFHASGGSA